MKVITSPKVVTDLPKGSDLNCVACNVFLCIPD